MKLFSANIEDLRSLYVNELQKALDMEQKITKSLPDLIENSSDSRLAEAFRTHLRETEGHAQKVEALVHKHTGSNSSQTCKVVVGLSTEASDTIKDVKDPAVRDIALIGAGQQVEHHEIAVYGTLRRWAAILGLEDDVEVLKAIEAEEGKADKLLTEIADQVNYQAA